MQKIIIVYLILINLVAFIMMAVDKRKAIKGRWRIPEKALLIIAFLGGAIGSFVGMRICRHKIRKAKFVILVPMACIVYVYLLIKLMI